MITCLDTAAMAEFLNILGAGIVTTLTDSIVVHATSGDVFWDFKPALNLWCMGV